MAKITVPALLKRGLIEGIGSSCNPGVCYVTEAKGNKVRMYLTAGRTYRNGRLVGVRAEKQKDFRVVASDKIISRYVLPSGAYRYKCEGVLFLTSLEKALVQAGFDIYNYPD